MAEHWEKAQLKSETSKKRKASNEGEGAIGLVSLSKEEIDKMLEDKIEALGGMKNDDESLMIGMALLSQAKQLMRSEQIGRGKLSSRC